MLPCRLLIDERPQSGRRNMAVDAALLHFAVERGVHSLRFYRWDSPTVSLGHFQDPAEVSRHPALRGLPIVRRLSGGGAIVHDQELTYSCALSAAHPLVRDPIGLYTIIHQAFVSVLSELGVPLTLRGGNPPAGQQAFLCFDRQDRFDVVAGSTKVLGSAQRRRKGAILQHGSLVLRRSASAPQFLGVADLASRAIALPDLVDALVRGVSGVLGAHSSVSDLSPVEGQFVDQLLSIEHQTGD